MKRLVPDGLGPLLRELPSLPTRRAILLGWAAPAPILVEIRDLPKRFQPESPDPTFWNVLDRRGRIAAIDWSAIAATWQGSSRSPPSRLKPPAARAEGPPRAELEEGEAAPAADVEGLSHEAP